MMEENALIEYVTRQRWYGAKSKTVSHSEVLDTITIRQAEPELSLALVEMRYDTGAHDIYQLLFSGGTDGVTFDSAREEAGIAREIVSAIDRSSSVWSKWDAQREEAAKAAASCWIPVEDLRAFLNNLPGPLLTKTDVEQRLRAIWE